jgi:hypothetical protein
MRIESARLNLGFSVSRENVLEAYKLVHTEWSKLGEVVSQNAPMLEIDLCGDDPVSHDAQRVFNPRLSELRAQSTTYVDGLDEIARKLLDSARAYGYTDDQIKASLTSAAAGPGPSSSAPIGPGGPLPGYRSLGGWAPPQGWGPR